MLGSLEPARPCLILKECVRVPAQQSRPWPDWESGAPAAVAALGGGSLAGQGHTFQGRSVTQTCVARVG